MLVGSSVRRVAVLGGSRIPFARAHGAYAGVGNAEMMTAALRGVVERFALQGLRLGEVAAGAVMKHSKDFNLVRECVLSTGLDPQTPGPRPAARLRHRPRGRDHRRQQDRARPDRRRHRRRRRHDQRHAGRLSARLPAAAAAVVPRPLVLGAHEAVLRHPRRSTSSRSSPARSSRAPASRWARATELMAKHWKIPREAQDQLAYASHVNAAKAWKDGFNADLVQPFNGLATDNNIRADTTPERLAKLKPSFDPTSGAGHAHRRQQHAADRRRLRGAARVRRLGACAEPARAGLAHPRQGLGRRLRRRPRRPADGARLRGARDARRRRASRCRTSTTTRSTRPSPRRCCAR